MWSGTGAFRSGNANAGRRLTIVAHVCRQIQSQHAYRLGAISSKFRHEQAGVELWRASDEVVHAFGPDPTEEATGRGS